MPAIRSLWLLKFYLSTTKLYDSAGRVLPSRLASVPPPNICFFILLAAHGFGLWCLRFTPRQFFSFHFIANWQIPLSFLISVLEMENLIGPVGLPGPGHAQIYWQGNGFADLESDAHIWFTNLWAQGLDKQGIKHQSPSYRPWGQGIVLLDHAVGKTGINSCHPQNTLCLCSCNSQNFRFKSFIKITNLTNSHSFLI